MRRDRGGPTLAAMTQESEQSPAAQARAIAESLIPEQLRDATWTQRWDELETWTSPAVSEVELRRRYVDNEGVAGDVDQDVLATACMVRLIDL